MANRYTGELWHYGIHGQKWGVRRYQNKDGSLTPLGREHYGYGPPREKIGSAKSSIKRGAERLGEGVVRGIKSKLAEKMPFMLNDEELERYNNRLMKEANYKNALANKRDAARRAKGTNFFKKLAEDSTTRAVNNIIDPVTRKLGNNLAETGTERRVRQSKAAADIEKNELDLANSANKKNIERNIRELASNDTEYQDNSNKMTNLLAQYTTIGSKLLSMEKERNATPSNMNPRDLKARNERLDREMAKLGKEMVSMQKEYGDLDKRNKEISYRNDELADQTRKYRAYLDSYNQTQKSPINKDQYDTLLNNLADKGIDIEDLLKRQ